MRLQEGSETRRYVEQTAGDTNVMQAVSYHANDMGTYREAQHAEIRRVARIEWNDLRGLIEGEAIIVFGNRRIYAKLFHAHVDPDGPMRLNRPVVLRPPVANLIQRSAERILAIRDVIENGWARPDDELSGNAALCALVDAFTDAMASGTSVAGCASAAIRRADTAMAGHPAATHVQGAAPGEIPSASPGEMDSMLQSARNHEASESQSARAALAPVTDTYKQRDLTRIEELAGAPVPVARIAAKEGLAISNAVGSEDRVPVPTNLGADVLRQITIEINAALGFTDAST
jgi:intracellular multiplication protein IcmO